VTPSAIRTVLAILIGLTAAAQPKSPSKSTPPLPRFEDYPVAEIFKGTPAAPQIVTPEARTYRTRIREGVANGAGVLRDGKEQPGPNFAGHYIVVQIMCGSLCTVMLIVDAQTGVVYNPPISAGSSGSDKIILPYVPFDLADWEFHVNSRLFKITGCGLEGQQSCSTYYFLWDHNVWKRLHQDPLQTSGR
jgi:hypothetical protein